MPPTPPAIRPMTAADIPAAIALFRASVRQVARRDYGEAQVRAWAPDHIDPAGWAVRFEGSLAWMALSDGVVAGFCVLKRSGLVDMMFSHPGFQGRGIASALLAQAEAAALDLGLSTLRTEASLTARPFFLARGFRVLRRQRVSLRGQDFTNFRMEKTLGPKDEGRPSPAAP